MVVTMQPAHLKDDRCPCCNAETRELKIHDQHITGNWNEYRVYKCGMSMEYSPNYDRVKVTNPCQANPETQAAKKKRVEAFDSLLRHIAELDVDDYYRDFLRNGVESHLKYGLEYRLPIPQIQKD